VVNYNEMKKLILLLPFFLLTSCNEEKPKIEEGDLVSYCVVDSVWIEKPISTLDVEPKFKYRTTCGNILTSRMRQFYSKGDTITFVKKNVK